MDNVENVAIEDQIFEKHYAYYKGIGIETIQQQAGQVDQVGSDYQGRVIFELLQNAFDKAKNKILVNVVGNVLYVANDGEKFNFVADYDYDTRTTKRGDFQSLCSISTTTKNSTTSIGNKGVGFKSAFSIAKDNYVNVYTNGEIINLDGSITNKGINFRIYDSFRNADCIPEELDSDVKNNLKKKIQLVQSEYNERGVPGFYFPLHIKNGDEIINRIFEDGYVTIIEIPFLDKEEIKKLYEEIGKIHFQFVRLKYPDYPDNFNIRFIFDKDNYVQLINNHPERLFYAIIDNEEIKQLAKDAGVHIELPVVAFLVKDQPTGLLYNYLPTQVKSPFQYIDFHADFHTTVDRKSINFDSKIGNYNSALLQACIELYLIVLNNSLDIKNRVVLKLKYINEDKVRSRLSNFNWNLLLPESFYQSFMHVRYILSVWNVNNYNFSYESASKFLAALAANYFKIERSKDQHHDFFKVVNEFINYFGREWGQKYEWLNFFKYELASKLKENEAKIIPEFGNYYNNELIYRKLSEDSFSIPNFIGINITNFEIKDEYFKRTLGIKDFTDYNEILRFYQQVSYSGKYLKESISEDQQKELLKSIVAIYKNKQDTKEAYYSSTHRFEFKENKFTPDNAFFNISSVFLKTKTGKFKPAQLCRKSDLNISFIGWKGPENEFDLFLKFLGVSLDSQFIFADERIYNSLKDGLDYIPEPYGKKNSGDKLIAELVLNNINVINVKARDVELIHPAIINDNYSFLKNIHGSNIKSELEQLLVKRYERFPREYINILYDKIEEIPIGIEVLYPSLFQIFHNDLGKYLTRRKKQLKWLESKDQFYVAKTKNDYLELIKTDISILSYSDKYDVPHELAHKKISLEEGSIKFEGAMDVTSDILNRINSRMVYILAAISNSLQSDLNFKDDSSKIKELQRKINDNLKVYLTKKLSRKILCTEINLEFENEFEALIDNNENTIYFIENCSTRKKTELLSRYFFNNNAKILSELEIIIFLKSQEELETDYEKEEIHFFRQRWIEDYPEKFSRFQSIVLNGFIYDENEIVPHWNIYDNSHKSSLIVRIFNQGKLNELNCRIENTKSLFNGLFDDFILTIDFGMYDSIIAKMISFLEDKQEEIAIAFILELKQLSKMIGIECRLNFIEQEILSKYQYDSSSNIISGSKSEIEKLKFERRLSDILEKIPKLNTLSVDEFTANGKPTTINININHKKLIFQGKNPSFEDSDSLEITGANGEEQVLGFYIIQFLKLNPEKRRQAIFEIYELIKEKLGNDSHLLFKEKCNEVIEDNEKLKSALIPFLYISLSHKFSYFDLIGYKNDKPVIVEVKTTRNESNDSFYISNSEVNEARNEVNYEIVRVLPSKIIFMGNPIRELNDKITAVEGINYKLIPKNYKFEYTNPK